MTKAQKIREVKQIVRLIEAATGKKVLFKEADEKEEETVVSKLQEINTILSDDTVSAFQQRLSKVDNNLGSSFQKFVANLTAKNSEAIQVASGALKEDVTMTTDQAVDDPETLKKLADKDIDINLTDDEDTIKL